MLQDAAWRQPFFAPLLRDDDGQAPAASCSLPPPLGLADFETALRQHQPSSHHAQQYRAADLARTQVRHLALFELLWEGSQRMRLQGWGVIIMLQRVQAAPDMLAALQLAALQMQMGMAAVPNGMGGSGLGGSNGAGRRPPPPQQPAGRT